MGGRAQHFVDSSLDFFVACISPLHLLRVQKVLLSNFILYKSHFYSFNSVYSKGTQWEYTSKPLKHSIVKHILGFKR